MEPNLKKIIIYLYTLSFLDVSEKFSNFSLNFLRFNLNIFILATQYSFL